MDGTGAELSPGRSQFVQTELRFEIGLLHDRVNALLTAEAFLTIAYTGAMSNGTAWGSTFSSVVAPVLSALGLLLALLAWPGISATVQLILGWTAERDDLTDGEGRSAAPRSQSAQPAAARRTRSDQARSMLFFRTVPGLFALVWTVLAVVALVLPR